MFLFYLHKVHYSSFFSDRARISKKYPVLKLTVDNTIQITLNVKQDETTQPLFECEGYADIRSIVVKRTPMETLKENDMTTLAGVLKKIKE